MNWLENNYKWLFDGVVGIAMVAVIGFLLRRLFFSAAGPATDNSVALTASPHIEQHVYVGGEPHRQPQQQPLSDDSGPSVQFQTVHTIDFDYLPISPLEKGWTQAYNDDGVADFGSDPDIPGSLRMRILKSEVAIHHNLPPHAMLADFLEFTAAYTNANNPTMIFTRLVVSAKDGSVPQNVDLKYYLGRSLSSTQTFPNPNPGRNPNKWLPEQTLHWPAKILPGGKLRFSIDLKRAVSASLGHQGLVFHSIQGVRLRGNLSISPILFCRTD